MHFLSQLLNPTAFRALWYGGGLFCWWAFGFEFVVVMLLLHMAFKEDGSSF